MREFNISHCNGDDPLIAPAWRGAIEGTITKITTCEFGMAEEVIGLVTIEGGMFEVGVGESLRPYIQVYRGEDEDWALTEFLKACMDRIH